MVVQVEEGVDCVFTRCPEFQCEEVVTENFFEALMPPDKLASYHRSVRLTSSRA